MEVQFTCTEGSDLTQLLKAYPELYHDDTYDGFEYWWIGKSKDDYWNPDRECYDYGDGEHEELSDQRDDGAEYMTLPDAVEFCGFAETLIEGSHTLLEGNGSWAQRKLRNEPEYHLGSTKAKTLQKAQM